MTVIYVNIFYTKSMNLTIFNHILSSLNQIFCIFAQNY